MHSAAQLAEVQACAVGARKQLTHRGRSFARAVFVLNAMGTARAAQMLTQQLPSLRIEQAYVQRIPLHANPLAYPPWWRSVVRCFHFHAPIQVHRALAVAVMAEGLERQRVQGQSLFSEHYRDLPFRGAVDARIGPALFPSVEVLAHPRATRNAALLVAFFVHAQR